MLDITITILVVQANQVRIGVDAPRNVPVHREEIHQRMDVSAVPEAYGKTTLHRNGVACAFFTTCPSGDAQLRERWRR